MALGGTQIRLPSKKICTCFPYSQKGRMVNRRWLCLDRANNLFFIRPNFFVLTQKQKVNYTSYRCYSSPVLKGEPWATEEGTLDTSESEAALTWAQRTSASSSARFTLHLDPSSPSLVFSSRKCNKAATNVDQAPQQTPIDVVVSTRPSSSSATINKEIAGEDSPSTPSSTKPRTHAAEVRNASSLACTSRCAASSTSRHPVVQEAGHSSFSL
jgi:hypothetical protein